MIIGHRVRAGFARWHPLLWGMIAALLLLPLVAMRFTDEVAWTTFDFAVAALLLVGGGLAFEFASLLTRRPLARGLAGAAILLLVVLIWLEGAVGIV